MMRLAKANAGIRFFGLLVGVLTISLPSPAQVDTGAIVGVVTDPKGAVVPKASMTVTEVATGYVRRAETQGDGSYRVGSLSPGNYEISTSATGFKTETIRGLILQVGQIARADVALQIGQAVQKVNVDTSTPILETGQATVGQVIDSEQILQLPLNGREFFQLAALTPGVVFNTNTYVATSYIGGSVSGNGFTPASTNVLVDGIQNTEFGIGRLDFSPSIDMIQEFKIQTNTYDAEFGGSTGPQITMITKRGTLKYHGSLFGFYRDASFDAQNYFQVGPVPAFHRSQYGGTFGGRIPKSRKDFFFFDYEGQRQVTVNTVPMTVPNAAIRGGDFSATGTTIYDPASFNPVTGQRQPFPGNVIPPARITQQGAYVETLWPLPQTSAATNNFIANPRLLANNDQYTIRYDRDFSDKDTVMFRYSHVNNVGLAIGNEPLPGLLTNQLYPGFNIASAYTHIFGSTMLNSFTFGVSRFDQRRDNETSTPGVYVNGGSHGPLTGTEFFAGSGILGVPSALEQFGTATVNVSGFSSIGDSSVGVVDSTETHYQAYDTFTLTAGRHTLKMGGGFLHSNFNLDAVHSTRGTISFAPQYTTASTTAAGNQYNALAAFLLGQVSSSSINLNKTLTTQLQGWWNAFVQDDLKLGPDLTLNLGLRYEVYQVPVEKYNRITALDLATQQWVFPGSVPTLPGTPTNSTTAAALGYSRSLEASTQYDTFGPRFGFSWRVFGSHSTVLRGGYGLFYSWLGSDYLNGLSAGLPWVGQAIITSNLDTPAVSFQNPFVSTLVPRTGGGVAIKNNQTPNVSQYSLGFQQAFGSLLSLDVAYVGNAVHKNSFDYNFDQPLPGPGSVASRSPYPGYSSLVGAVNEGSANYNALQVTVRNNVGSTGLSILGTYSWGKDLGNSYPGTAYSASLPYRQYSNFKADYGPTLFSLDNTGSLAVLYTLPVGNGKRIAGDVVGFANAVVSGWTLGTISSFRSGFYLTPSDSQNTSNAGGSRPDQIRDTTSLSHHTTQEFFNTAAFQRAALYTFGTASTGTIVGPGSQDWDVSIQKVWSVRERTHFQFRFDLFNAFNHPTFSNPGTAFGTGSFGVISGAGNGRQLQAGLRLDF